jgi:hypothetical protein
MPYALTSEPPAGVMSGVFCAINVGGVILSDRRERRIPALREVETQPKDFIKKPRAARGWDSFLGYITYLSQVVDSSVHGLRWKRLVSMLYPLVAV